MLYKLMGSAALAGASGVTGLVIVNRERIFGKSKTLSDDLKEKSYKLVSEVKDESKRNAILVEKLKAYQALKDPSQGFKGKGTMNVGALLETCKELEKSSNYEDVISQFKKWCSLDFKDVLVTVNERKVILEDGADGANWKASLKVGREKMKSVIDGVTGDDTGDSQWEKVKEWCSGKFDTQYSNDSKVDFDRVEEWCLEAKAQ